ncbi:MAG TPA: sodium:proton exchanger [Polyangiales bacterium]|jgi:Kef-type K+ transport system membrane component KefB|nr:sodium:proton exchanger [Polyangiales bacterium]
MSHAATPSTQSLAVTRLIQLFGLIVVFGAVYVTTRITPAFEGSFGVISAVGFLLLAGMLASSVLESVGLPHLTAYILVGVVAGPHALHLVDHQAVIDLAPVNTLALALIALAGGAELRVPLLLPLRRSLSWTTLMQCAIGTVGASAAFLAASRLLPFTHGQSISALIGIALLWGVLAVSRSPSATLGILAQTRPDGPLSRFSLAFVMSSDIVVAVLVTLTITLVRPLIDPATGIALKDLMALWHEILGSITLGTTVGLLLALYLWLVSGQLLLVLLALGFGLTEGLRYLHFDPLLTFLTAGFVVANLSNQGHKLLHAVEETGSVVFVVFFATAGAHLDVPLVKQLWPVTLLLAGSRVFATVVAHRVGSRLAQDPPIVQRWGWAPLVSQAGLTLGMSALIERAFPTFGAGFRSLAVATVAVNELIGPVLFKLALDKTGESGKGALLDPATRHSVPPPAVAPHT